MYITVAEEYYTAKGKEEVAINLLADNVPIDVIIKNTGVSLERIQTFTKLTAPVQ